VSLHRSCFRFIPQVGYVFEFCLYCTHDFCFYFIAFPYPTSATDKIIVTTPMMMVVFVRGVTPFHSLSAKPHMFATSMMNAMWSIHELAPLPSLLSSMP